MKPVVLILIPLADRFLDQVRERFEVIHAPTAAERSAALTAHADRIAAVLTNGSVGLAAAEIDALPLLRFASALGAGYENLAVDHARQRGIALANGAGANDDCVADHAIALLLATVRSIPRLDAAARAGAWRDALPMQPQFSGKRLGILGLGTIGAKIASRGAAFDLAIGYHNRSPRPSPSSYRYFDTVPRLAAWCDYLVVATPGGPGNASPRRRRGARGARARRISRQHRPGQRRRDARARRRARGRRARRCRLDVYESEPAPPESLLRFDNVVLTPHVAGRSPESVQATVDCFLDNAALHFAGEPLRTPI